jgi:TolA-binding protein
LAGLTIALFSQACSIDKIKKSGKTDYQPLNRVEELESRIVELESRIEELEEITGSNDYDNE